MKIKPQWARLMAMAISICSATSGAADDAAASGLERRPVVIETDDTVDPVSRAAARRAGGKLSLAARSDDSQTNGVSATISSIAVTAQQRPSSPARPYTAGILFEYGLCRSAAIRRSSPVCSATTRRGGPGPSRHSIRSASDRAANGNSRLRLGIASGQAIPSVSSS